MTPPRTARPPGRFRSYIRLTKPRVIELLLITTVPSMILAEGHLPPAGLLVGVVSGGALAAGGANATNCYIDRNRDRIMRRTRHRPIPAGEVPPSAALGFGIVLEAVAFVWLLVAANLLAASLTLAAAGFYIFVYSVWLKPRTPQSIVIGGAAGAVPVLVGWAAVRGTIGWPALVLFLVVVAWTPAHFWALALRHRDDYAAASVPMLPVVAGPARTCTSISRYAVATVLASLVLYPVAGTGVAYLGAASVLGGLFVWRSIGLRRDPSQRSTMRFFTFSNTYLALLFVAIAVDALLL